MSRKNKTNYKGGLEKPVVAWLHGRRRGLDSLDIWYRKHTCPAVQRTLPPGLVILVHDGDDVPLTERELLFTLRIVAVQRPHLEESCTCLLRVFIGWLPLVERLGLGLPRGHLRGGASPATRSDHLGLWRTMLRSVLKDAPATVVAFVVDEAGSFGARLVDFNKLLYVFRHRALFKPLAHTLVCLVIVYTRGRKEIRQSPHVVAQVVYTLLLQSLELLVGCFGRILPFNSYVFELTHGLLIADVCFVCLSFRLSGLVLKLLGFLCGKLVNCRHVLRETLVLFALLNIGLFTLVNLILSTGAIFLKTNNYILGLLTRITLRRSKFSACNLKLVD
eukprot:Colp12_sorted_trinity150504_noHs@29260